jgi:hypothetical protein
MKTKGKFSQAVIPRSLAKETLARPQACTCGNCGDKVALGQVSLHVHWFYPVIMIPKIFLNPLKTKLNHLHSSNIETRNHTHYLPH